MTVQEREVNMSPIYGCVCCCVTGFGFCEETSYMSAPSSISRHVCSVELQNTLILSNTIVYRQGNHNKVTVKFMVDLGLKPRSSASFF